MRKIWFSQQSRTASSPSARANDGTSNYSTLEEMHAALDADVFWRPHRSYLVNIHHIKEVVPGSSPATC